MERHSPTATKKSARANSGMDTRTRYADDMVLQGQKARSTSKNVAKEDVQYNNDGLANCATDIAMAIALANNNEHRQRPIVVLDKRFLELTETPLLHSGDTTAYKADKAENATMKIIAHTAEEEFKDDTSPVAYEKWSKVHICEYIATEWSANRLPAKKAFQQYFIKEHGKYS